MEVSNSGLYPAATPVDPFVETDESGEEVVLHRQVTWN